jgi:hypothetical protein
MTRDTTRTLNFEQEGWPPRHAPAREPSSNASTTGSAKSGYYYYPRLLLRSPLLAARVDRRAEREGATIGPPFERWPRG